MKIMSFIKIILKNLFSKPATNMYPFTPREYPERTRGHVKIDIDACIFCGICGKKCPTGAITVNRDEKSWEIARFNCIQCNSCVEVCPKKCMSMGTQYTAPSTEKYSDKYIQEQK